MGATGALVSAVEAGGPTVAGTVIASLLLPSVSSTVTVALAALTAVPLTTRSAAPRAAMLTFAGTVPDTPCVEPAGHSGMPGPPTRPAS